MQRALRWRSLLPQCGRISCYSYFYLIGSATRLQRFPAVWLELQWRGRGLGVSGGNPNSRCCLGLEPWMWVNFSATRYERREGSGYRPLTRARVSGRGTRVPSSHFLSPLSPARVPSFLMSELLISLHSPETPLGPFSFSEPRPLPLNSSLGLLLAYLGLGPGSLQLF